MLYIDAQSKWIKQDTFCLGYRKTRPDSLVGAVCVSIVSKTFRETRDKDLKTTLAPGKLVLAGKVHRDRVNDSILLHVSDHSLPSFILRARVTILMHPLRSRRANVNALFQHERKSVAGGRRRSKGSISRGNASQKSMPYTRTTLRSYPRVDGLYRVSQPKCVGTASVSF